MDDGVVRMLRDDADGALEAGDEGGGDGVGLEAVGSSALGSWALSADATDWCCSECPGPPLPAPLGPEDPVTGALAPSWNWDSADSRCPRCRSRTRPTSSPLPPCPCCRCCCCCCGS